MKRSTYKTKTICFYYTIYFPNILMTMTTKLLQLLNLLQKRQECSKKLEKTVKQISIKPLED